MTNFTKFLSIVFGVLLILTLLVSFFGGHTSSEAFRSSLLDFSPASVDRIEIENPNRDYVVVLTREDGQWLVESQDGSTTFAASDRMVNAALEELSTMEISAVVARSPDRHARYHVDREGTNVRLFGGGRGIGSIVVGRFHFQSQTQFYTYVRPSNSDDVFTVPAFLNATVARDIPEWRDRRIWNLDASAISEVHFVFPADSSYSIQYQGNNIWVSGTDTLNSSLVNSMLQQLSDFSADSFPAINLNASDFGEEKYLINIAMDTGEQRNIRLAPLPEDTARFQATADGFPYIFNLQRNRFKNTVMRPKRELLP